MRPVRPTLSFEIHLWNQGFSNLAGVDEVGRGALAGPVCVAAVIFPKAIRRTPLLSEVRDSKLLTPNQRQRLAPLIKSLALRWSYGKSSPAEIDRVGIVKATLMAMRRAVYGLRRTDFVLVDAYSIPYLRGVRRKRQIAVKHGDVLCFSIAAASILAKVYRDRIMVRLGRRYPNFHLERHKGYGTLLHRQALSNFGPTPLHRKSFIRNFI